MSGKTILKELKSEINRGETPCVDTILGIQIAKFFLLPLAKEGEKALKRGNNKNICAIQFARVSEWPSEFGDEYPLETRRVLRICADRFSKRYEGLMSIAA